MDTNGNVYSKRKNKYLKQTINKFGYCQVTLQKNKYKKMFSVHRLVAEAFIPNPENKPQVNHIDSNRKNNYVENLEWVTPKENMQHAVKNHRFDNMAKINSEKLKNNPLNGYIYANEITKKKVAQYDKENKLLNEYESISEASRKTGITITNISYCANGKRKSGGGYIWHFI